MPEKLPDALGLALTYLRSAAGWNKTQLADTLGIKKEAVSQYEGGAKTLTRENLDSLVAPLAPPEAVDILLLAHDLIFPERQPESPSPFPFSSEERQTIHRALMTTGRTAVEAMRAELMRTRNQEKAEAAKQEAESLFRILAPLSRKERSALVEVFPDYWSWALAVRTCEASVKKAAHRADEALELAELALFIAEQIPGEESWRSRLKGYCWAHVANARRVANDLSGADKAFDRAWDLWRAGSDSTPEFLAEWRLFSLEASLRRAERRFSEALELLDQAKARCGNDPIATGRILLKKESVFNQVGDIQGAVVALMEATPYIEVWGDEHLLFALRFNMTDDLCHLQRYAEAAKLLPLVRELAVQQANELDLVRVAWLSGKIAAGQGRKEEAIASLDQVRQDFTVHELPYDAALSSLDLSVLWLLAGRAAEVRGLAITLGWIFKAKGIDREALAALSLFCKAARQEKATVELAKRVISEIEQARRSASPLCKERDRG